MPIKAQHARAYRQVPALLRGIRENAGLTQRQLGAKLSKPQSWIYNCESLNRRIDVAEFVLWCRACNVDPAKAVRLVSGTLP